MPVMSSVEGAFCRSRMWQVVARRAVLPWTLDGHRLTGEVLEIGSGGGAMADGFSRCFPRARLTVTDLDPAMVSRARDLLARHPNVRVESADVTALPYAEASFDALTSYLMLHHVIDWQDALAEAARVLRPGGMILGYDSTDTRLARWVHRLDRSPHRMIAASEMRVCLADVGFERVAVVTSARGHLMRFAAVKPEVRKTDDA